MLNACAEAHAFASLTQWKCSILGVLLPFLALNWLNIRFFPMLGTKTQLLWGNLSIFDTKTQIFPQFWPKNWNKNYYFFQIGQFLALYSIVFTIFGSQNPFCWKNWSIFHPYTQFSPNYWPSSAPACPFFCWKLVNFWHLYSIFQQFLT